MSIKDDINTIKDCIFCTDDALTQGLALLALKNIEDALAIDRDRPLHIGDVLFDDETGDIGMICKGKSLLISVMWESGYWTHVTRQQALKMRSEWDVEPK